MDPSTGGAGLTDATDFRVSGWISGSPNAIVCPGNDLVIRNYARTERRLTKLNALSADIQCFTHEFRVIHAGECNSCAASEREKMRIAISQ